MLPLFAYESVFREGEKPAEYGIIWVERLSGINQLERLLCLCFYALMWARTHVVEIAGWMNKRFGCKLIKCIQEITNTHTHTHFHSVHYKAKIAFWVKPPVVLFISSSHHSPSFPPTLSLSLHLCQWRLLHLNQAHKDAQEHLLFVCRHPHSEVSHFSLFLSSLSPSLHWVRICLSDKTEEVRQGCHTVRHSLSLCSLYSSLPVCCLLWLARAPTGEQPIYILWRLQGLCESEGKEIVMWNVNRETLICFLNSVYFLFFIICLCVCVAVCMSWVYLSVCLLITCDYLPLLSECATLILLFPRRSALRCPASYKWDLVTLKMNVQEKEVAFTCRTSVASSINSFIQCFAWFFP